METKNENGSVKFYEAIRICSDFAEKLIYLGEANIPSTLELLRLNIKTFEETLAFLGTDAPSDITEGIREELQKSRSAYKAVRSLDKKARNELFHKLQKHIFRVEGGDATQLIKELTEYKPLCIPADNWEPNPAYPLDTANCPVISTINGGEYRCRSNYPTRDSEKYAILYGIAAKINKLCDDNSNAAEKIAENSINQPLSTKGEPS